jgi:hypothetical protein
VRLVGTHSAPRERGTLAPEFRVHAAQGFVPTNHSRMRPKPAGNVTAMDGDNEPHTALNVTSNLIW